MTDLSPAAKAVLDAFNREARPEPHHQQEAIAAALRAASARMPYLVSDICHPKYIEGVESFSYFLDEIANELEGIKL